jgi:hypothetical protein
MNHYQKPLIRRQCGVWVCSASVNIAGYGLTPRDAYEAWIYQRRGVQQCKHF